MSGSLHTWYSLPDLDRLAECGATLRGEIELKRLPRLDAILHADRGSVRASLRFRQRSSGWLTVTLECDATLELTCQRCLEPLAHHVSTSVELGLLESETVENPLPEGCEPFVLEGGRLLPAQLIEEELIVSLPLVPRHARREQCGDLVGKLESRNAETGSTAQDGASPISH
jgi:uncharacterized protein